MGRGKNRKREVAERGESSDIAVSWILLDPPYSEAPYPFLLLGLVLGKELMQVRGDPLVSGRLMEG